MSISRWTESIPATRDAILALDEMGDWDEDQYEFIIQAIRDDDQMGGERLIQRFLEGPNYLNAKARYQVEIIKDLWSIDRCPNEYLRQLASLIGLPDFVYMQIIPQDGQDAASHYQTLRNFLKVAPFIMNLTGTDKGMRLWILAATGNKPHILFPRRERATLGLSFTCGSITLCPGHPSAVIYVPWVEGETNEGLVKSLIKWNQPLEYRVSLQWSYMHQWGTAVDAREWIVHSGSVAGRGNPANDLQFQEV